MNPQKIVLTLGYLSLILLAVYFVTGLLKIGGEGLSKLGYTETFIEGMTNEERREQKMERLAKKMDATIKQYDEMSEDIDKKNDEINQVMALSEFSQILEIYKSQKETDIKQKLVDAASNGRGIDNIAASIIKDAQLIQALDSYGSSGGGGMASKATGGYF